MDQQRTNKNAQNDENDISSQSQQQDKYKSKQYKMTIEQVENCNVNEAKAKKQIKCGIRDGCQDINNFKRLNRIHEGTYGVVYRAEDMKTKQVVAIKKLKLNNEKDFPITSLRQIAILKTISHDNIIKIKKISGNSERTRVFIVMEYMDHEMKALLKTQTVFNQSQIRRLMKDLLSGIDFLHQKNIVHRDLKSSNLLYSNEGILKICDFGLARRISPSQMTQEVISLWYRAPQLLLGPTIYSTQIDMWSIGCIFAQFVMNQSIFQGKNQIEQLDCIFKLLGSPTNQTWPNYKECKNSMYVIGNKYPQNKLASIIPKQKLSAAGLDLLLKLLTPYPRRRISAQKALKHDWFKGPIAERSQMPSFNAINQMDRVKKAVKI